MFGHDDDLLLRLNPHNCPAFGKALYDNHAILDQKLAEFEKVFFPELAKLIGQNDI